MHLITTCYPSARNHCYHSTNGRWAFLDLFGFVPARCELSIMQEAAAADGETQQQAKLCFAHAETIIPLACLLGLFGTTNSQLFSNSPPSQCGAQSTLQQPGNGNNSAVAGSNSGQNHASKLNESNTLASQTATTDLPNEPNSLGICSNEVEDWVPPLPQPPKARSWHGSMIAPYGANIQFMLHRRKVCIGNAELPSILTAGCCLAVACNPAFFCMYRQVT